MASCVRLFLEDHMPEIDNTECPSHLDALAAAPAIIASCLKTTLCGC
jgi:hypothetical protein